MTVKTGQSTKRFHPSAFLLTAQLLQLALFAVFEDQPAGHTAVAVMGVAILALRLWVVQRTPGVDWIAWVLAVPTLALSIISALSGSPVLGGWSAALEALLYFYTAGSLIAYMLADYQVTTDEWFAAGATFTLLAWGFAYAFLAGQAAVPNAFINAFNQHRTFTFVEMLSLSFTNLTATGLSDILPSSATARVLIMLTQFSGIGYVAIVISRLVAMAMARINEKKSSV